MTVMKIFNFLFAVMFLLFAYLQINDPDPFIWITIYGTMAVMAIMAMFNYFPKKVIIALLIIFFLYSLVFIPGVQDWLAQENKEVLFDNVAKMEHLFIEESREFLGLWICIAVLIFYFIRARKVS